MVVGFFGMVRHCKTCPQVSQLLYLSACGSGGNMPFFAYGYFVRLPNGNIAAAGHDFSSTLDSKKVGDSLGVRDGMEGIVIGVVKGKPAKMSGGYDVFVLVEKRQ